MSRVFHFSHSTKDPRIARAIFRSLYKDCDRKWLRKVVVAVLQAKPEMATLANQLAASCGTQFDVVDPMYRFTAEAADYWKRFCLRTQSPKQLCITVASKERFTLYPCIKTVEALVGPAAQLKVCDHPEWMSPQGAREFLAVESAVA